MSGLRQLYRLGATCGWCCIDCHKRFRVTGGPRRAFLRLVIHKLAYHHRLPRYADADPCPCQPPRETKAEPVADGVRDLGFVLKSTGVRSIDLSDIQFHFDAAPNIFDSPGRVFWAPARKDPRDQRGVAPHLRGKVTKADIGWEFRVVNTVTGRTVIRDDGCGDLADAFATAEFATQVARSAWMRGLRHKELAASGGREWV